MQLSLLAEGTEQCPLTALTLSHSASAQIYTLIMAPSKFTHKQHATWTLTCCTTGTAPDRAQGTHAAACGGGAG